MAGVPRISWATPADPAAVQRRAGGRRRHNHRRQFLAAYRRHRLLAVLGERSLFTRGVQAQLARELGVSRSTICRDLQFFRDNHQVFPTCGRGPGHLPDPLDQALDALDQADEGPAAETAPPATPDPEPTPDDLQALLDEIRRMPYADLPGARPS